MAGSAPPRNAAERMPVSVVIPTRNRGESIRSTITSILDNVYSPFEIIIVDQSTDDLTELTVKPFLGNRNVRYIRTDTKGVSFARNIGLESATADIVLMTDDDCDVPTNWVEQIVGVFMRHPKVGLVFGNVVPGPHDPSHGFIPNDIAKENKLFPRLNPFSTNYGIGACMAMRKSVIQAIGGFEPFVGPGSVLKSAEEVDIALRVLLHGCQIYRLADVRVVHHGFRAHDDARTLVKGYMLGTGAVIMKLFRCGHWNVLPFYLTTLWLHALLPLLRNLIQLKRPLGLRRLWYFLVGGQLAYRMPVDRKRGVFTGSGLQRPLKIS